MRVRRVGAQPYMNGGVESQKSVECRWRRSQRAPEESRRSSENSRRGARARGPASCGGVEQAASWSGRTALRRSSDAEVVNGTRRASTLKEQKTRSLPRARRRPGPTDQAAVEARRPRGTEQATRQVAQAARPLSDWRVATRGPSKRHQGSPTRRPSSRHKGRSGNLPGLL